MGSKRPNPDTKQFFTDFLAAKKLRLTSQRKIIFNEFINRRSHMDIDELYSKARAKDRNIGLATIYRTLKLLMEAGIVREVKLSAGKPSYEAVIGREHHDHLTCEICGENIEFNEADMEDLQEKIASKYGYKLTGHAMYLTGICRNCKEK